MTYRAFSVFIVVFWLTMTGLLLRNECWPGNSALREVPVEHVIKLLLVHGESSDLNIFSEKLRLGLFHLRPSIRKDDDTRDFEFSGNLRILIPGMERQNVSWIGEWKMDKELATRSFHIALSLKKPSALTVDIGLFPKANRAHYMLTTAGGLEEERDFSLDAAGLRTVAQEFGLDPVVLDAAQSPHAEKPVIKAYQTSLEIRGGKIDTFLVTVEQSGQTLLEFHVDQLGRILQARTLVGYSLAPDDLGR
jgi:hypothetical protein